MPTCEGVCTRDAGGVVAVVVAKVGALEYEAVTVLINVTTCETVVGPFPAESTDIRIRP